MQGKSESRLRLLLNSEALRSKRNMPPFLLILLSDIVDIYDGNT